MQIPYDVMPATATVRQGVEPGLMKVLSVNVAAAEWRQINGQRVLTAIGKRPASGPVVVHALGLHGDEQADPSVHGGISKAVYAYPHAHFGFWQTVRAQARVAPWDEPLPPGALGENLTIEGLSEDRLWVGDRLQLPNCVLAVSEPRFPCFKFNAAMGFKQASKLMAANGWCGFYLAVRRAGTLRAGEPFELIAGPREVGIAELFRARVGRNRP